MSLIPLTLGIVGNGLARIAEHGCASRRVLSLGYPDILATREQVGLIFGAGFVERLRMRDDAEAILRWHGASGAPREVIDTRSLFEALGFALDVVDIAEARGGEIIADLNEPLPAPMDARYAAVIDAGTLEHCFNIGQAARNVAGAVAVGGFVMHGNPLNLYNHGFYNLNPTWYHDFYGANGFLIEQMEIVAGVAEGVPSTAKPPPVARFNGAPENSTVLVVARRVEVREIRWPIQSKYVTNPTLRK